MKRESLLGYRISRVWALRTADMPYWRLHCSQRSSAQAENLFNRLGGQRPIGRDPAAVERLDRADAEPSQAGESQGVERPVRSGAAPPQQRSSSQEGGRTHDAEERGRRTWSNRRPAAVGPRPRGDFPCPGRRARAALARRGGATGRRPERRPC